jgi:hypothetical protein
MLEDFGCDVVAPGLNGEGPLRGRLVVIASLVAAAVRLSSEVKRNIVQFPVEDGDVERILI